MIASTGRTLDAFWRATAYCLHPRVILLSLMPLVISVGLAFLLGWLYWEQANSWIYAELKSWQMIDTIGHYLSYFNADGFRMAIAPIVLVVLAVPMLVVLSLLLVALLMTPALVRMVARRRFALLERRRGGAAWWRSVLWSLGHCLLALALLIACAPFCLFMPPLLLVAPPLIWGWLGYRVFAYDVLAEHAAVDERRELFREHRLPLLVMGVVIGYLGAAPAAIWALGLLAFALAPFLVLASVWLYTLVFAFSTLWFAHYTLAALRDMRARSVIVEAPEASAATLIDAATPPLLP